MFLNHIFSIFFGVVCVLLAILVRRDLREVNFYESIRSMNYLDREINAKVYHMSISLETVRENGLVLCVAKAVCVRGV